MKKAGTSYKKKVVYTDNHGNNGKKQKNQAKLYNSKKLWNKKLNVILSCYDQSFSMEERLTTRLSSPYFGIFLRLLESFSISWGNSNISLL